MFFTHLICLIYLNYVQMSYYQLNNRYFDYCNKNILKIIKKS